MSTEKLASLRRFCALTHNLSDPETVETPTKEVLPQRIDSGDSEYRVIIYNCDCHGMEEVVAQLQKATNCDLETAMNIMLEAHTRGRAICYRSSRPDCHRVARILREIGLQCEVDCD